MRKLRKENGLPEGTIKWHLSKARNDLKEGLEMKPCVIGIHKVRALFLKYVVIFEICCYF